MSLHVGMDRQFFCGSDFQQSLKTLRLFANSFTLVSQKFPQMMPKIFLMLGLLAHGAVAVRSNMWLSEAGGNWSLKGWIARKRGEKELRRVQKRLTEELGISASRHQVEVLIARSRSGTFPKEVKDLDSRQLRRYAKWFLPLNVSASAVAFCGELVTSATESGIYTAEQAKRAIKSEVDEAAEVCSQVLTGNLSSNSGAPQWMTEMSGAPQWTVDAAQVAEMDGQQHPYGRLDGVAWKYSLKRLCHDECEELVQGIRDKARELANLGEFGEGIIQDACADKVVRHVEEEILGCCSKSCGWNGQFCAFFPFLNSTEQADWQAECCSERNILQGSSRQQMCDSTLSPGDRNKSHEIVDQRPNTAKDREILGQDENPASKSWNLCPPPINLHTIHYQQLFEDWKRMPLEKAKKGNKRCRIKERSSIGECKAFRIKEITDDEGRIKFHYVCWDDCNLVKPNIRLEDLADPAVGIGGFLYVHKDIYSAWK